MSIRFFTTKNRPLHLGPYPLERLTRIAGTADLADVPPFAQLGFDRLNTPHSLVNAMGEYQAMMDAIRDGMQPIQGDDSGCATGPGRPHQGVRVFF